MFDLNSCLNLTHKVMILGGVAFGRCLDHESGALMNGINALIKQTPTPTPQSSLASFTM